MLLGPHEAAKRFIAPETDLDVIPEEHQQSPYWPYTMESWNQSSDIIRAGKPEPSPAELP